MNELEYRLQSALRFVKQLPLGTVPPDPCFDNDGDICFDWYAGKDAQISVAVGPGYINWAAMLDGEKLHAHAVLGDTPAQVRDLIAAICKRSAVSANG